MISVQGILEYLLEHRYLAMFGAIFLSALGLPVPEEVTLIAAGLAVGWEKADFVLASLACIAGILASDAFNFALGRYAGAWFLRRRMVRWVLTEKRQARIRRLFDRHGAKAVFISRFVPVMRLGVHAYAGSHGLGWWRFLAIDLLGALITGPCTILIGRYAARRFADPQRAADVAQEWLANGSLWIWAALALGIVTMAVSWSRQRARPPAVADRQG